MSASNSTLESKSKYECFICGDPASPKPPDACLIYNRAVHSVCNFLLLNTFIAPKGSRCRGCRVLLGNVTLDDLLPFGIPYVGALRRTPKTIVQNPPREHVSKTSPPGRNYTKGPPSTSLPSNQGDGVYAQLPATQAGMNDTSEPQAGLPDRTLQRRETDGSTVPKDRGRLSKRKASQDRGSLAIRVRKPEQTEGEDTDGEK